jgi:arylsulfatase A-like enzyme
LKENGLDENTIVVYTSDQGFYLGEHGWFDKRFIFDESFKTPLIVKWPGLLKLVLKILRWFKIWILRRLS